MKIRLAWLFGLLISTLSIAQIQIGSGVSTDSLMVGDQFMYKIGAQGNQLEQVKWPKINKTIGEFEVIEKLGFDTVSTNPLGLELGFILTYFDTGYIELPGQILTLNGDTIETQKHFIQVLPVHIDSTNAQLFGLAPPIDVPYKFGEFKHIIIWSLVIAGVLLIVLLTIVFYRKRQRDQVIEEIKVPAHILALGELTDLETQKLIEAERVKDFYSVLSDILRRYLENRYNFLALESTTDEILKELKQYVYKTQNVKDIDAFLRDADLVKFAKALPEEHMHEQYFNFVKAFVLETKLIEELQGEEDSDE